MNRSASFSTIFLTLVLLVCFVSNSAWAGLVIKEKVQAENGMETIMTYIEGDMVKNVMPNGSYMIIDLTKREMIEVTPHKKQYSIIKIDEMKKEMDQAMSKLKEQLAGLPPEQRAMIEQMMGAKPAGSVSVKKTGQHAKVAGFKAEQYKILKNGRPVVEVWISNDLLKYMKKEMNSAKIKAFEKAMGSVDEMLSMMPAGSDDVLKKMKELEKEGHIVKEVDYSDPSNPVVVSQVIAVQKRNIPRSEFLVPQGYKKVSWKGMEKAR